MNIKKTVNGALSDAFNSFSFKRGPEAAVSAYMALGMGALMTLGGPVTVSAAGAGVLLSTAAMFNQARNHDSNEQSYKTALKAVKQHGIQWKA